MKILNSMIILFVLTIATVSCDNDEATAVAATTSTDLLIGEWEITDFVTNAMITSSFGAELRTAITEGMGSNFDYTIIFNDNNTMTTNGSYDFTVTVFVDDLQETRVISIEDTMLEGNWSQDEDQLILNGITSPAILPDSVINQVQVERTFTITDISETTLILTSDLQEFIPQNLPNGFEVNLSGSSVITLARAN